MVVLFPAVDAVSKAASSSQIATYAPVYETCPASNLIRRAGTPQTKNQTLDPNEVSYVASRRKLAKSSLQKWLGKNASAVYSGKIDELSDGDIPKLAVSLSGGNFRAAMFNVAALEAFNDRNGTSVSNGLGGLLQSSTYMTALSGGSYVSTSMMFNGFPRPSDLVFGNSAAGLPGWQLDQSLFEPGSSGEYTSAFEHDIFYDLGAKRSAGNFPVTFCDLWGRALAYHFLPGTSNVSSFATNATAGNHAASLTYSSATNLGIWQNHTMPFPIVLIDVNSPNVHGEPFGDTGSIPLTSVVYELTPYEFGSYDPQLAAFVPTQYLGSTFKGGYQETCVNRFDNAGLMVGTSSCDFNIYNVTDNPAWTSPDGFQPLIAEINETFYQYQPGQEMDVTSVTNPFYQINVGTYQDANETALSLMDGSLDVENDPILPLLNKKRAVDVVVVLDSSGETSYTKPDGLSLLATQEKAKILPEGTVNFPKPFPNTTDEFMSLGLNARPVFFGCDGPTNAEDAYPLLVYIPNDDPTGVTNISTSTLQLPVTNQSHIFDNSYLLASRGYAGINNTDLGARDAEWGTCVACAVVERTRARTGSRRTDACSSCFERYCFTGSSMTARPAYVSSASSSSVHLTQVTAGAAEDLAASAGSSADDWSTLQRNEYIIIGLLGAVLAVSVMIVALLLRGRKAERSFYQAGLRDGESRELLYGDK